MTNEVIFCLAALIFLGWVIYLKWQIGDFQAQIEKLKKMLGKYIRSSTADAELEKEEQVWGHKPPGFGGGR